MPDLLSNSEESSSGFTCNQILNRTKAISENCTQMGGIYLLSVLALQSLAAQDTLIDFFFTKFVFLSPESQ